MATGEIFGPVIDAFARRHTVDVPDLRGHGRSMHLEGPLTVEQHVRDLVRVIAHLDMLGTDILGYSQGGAVALQIAHDHSERVRRLVLVNTFAHNGLTIGERLENRVSLWALQLLGTGTLARILAGEGKPLTPEQVRRLRETMASSNRKRSVEDPERARMWPWSCLLNTGDDEIRDLVDEWLQYYCPRISESVSKGPSDSQRRAADGRLRASHILCSGRWRRDAQCSGGHSSRRLRSGGWPLLCRYRTLEPIRQGLRSNLHRSRGPRRHRKRNRRRGEEWRAPAQRRYQRDKLEGLATWRAVPRRGGGCVRV